jgi:phenol 2-monooxygenase (NADPH)
MIIPRERISPKQAITRIYCQMEDNVEKDPSMTDNKPEDSAEVQDAKAAAKKRRQKITVERIQEQTKKVLQPYTIEFNEVDWWVSLHMCSYILRLMTNDAQAAYQIGQRTSPRFSMADKNGVLRVHIAGDACHTHSPKSGQGMNVSMMDAYNLSWKLAHVLNGLVPESANLLSTYEHERHDIAEQLIEFDRRFSKMFSGKIGVDLGLTHEQFQETFNKGCGFTSGCGIEYRESLLVKKGSEKGVIKDRKFEEEFLTPGRRVLNVRVVRFCDANIRDIQDGTSL